MPTPTKAKGRATRIPLDYFKKPDHLERWRRGAWIAALLVAVAWLATGFSLGGPRWVNERDRLRYSHGPVARVHATWDARCEACHEPFSSIRGETWPAALGMKGGDADARCLACHRVADHSANMKPGEVGSCASCHRDHQGREASLIDRADARCVSCHGDLKAHVADAARAKGFANAITSFPANHPEFAPSLGDAKAGAEPAAIKFNHALHMTPGLNEAKDAKPTLTVAQADRRGVQLDCASCHHLGTQAGSSLSTGGGAYYLPVTYQKDCASCHKLDVAMSAGPASSVDSDVKTPTYRVPHGLQPDEIRGLLTNASIGVSMKPADPTGDGPKRPMPGRSAAVLSRLPQAAEVAARVQRAERILYGADKATCTECHSYRKTEGPLPTVVPTAQKTIWFAHATFDHSAHRGVSCKSCHEGAYATAEKPSRSSADVLIVGKTTCATCHAPEGRSETGLVGGAGQSCVECHRYHGGGHGAASLSAADDRSIQDFLNGSPPGPQPPSPAKTP